MSNRLLVRTKTTVSGNTSGPRDLQLRAALVAQGFVMTGTETKATASRLIRCPVWSAVSHEMDGQDIKALLRSLGFADSEFRIHMEFQRGWGCM